MFLFFFNVKNAEQSIKSDIALSTYQVFDTLSRNFFFFFTLKIIETRIAEKHSKNKQTKKRK